MVCGVLLLLAGCSFSEKEEPQEDDVNISEEEMLEKFGVNTDNFKQLLYGDIELTEDNGQGLLEYTLDYDEYDLDVERDDFEFNHDLYYFLSLDLELLTHLGLEDIGERNEEIAGEHIDKTSKKFDKDKHYSGMIYNIKDIGVITIDLDKLIHFSQERSDTIEFSWFIDDIEWDSERIEDKYKTFTRKQ